MSISIPADLKVRMDAVNVDWSRAAARAFEELLDALDVAGEAWPAADRGEEHRDPVHQELLPSVLLKTGRVNVIKYSVLDG